MKYKLLLLAVLLCGCDEGFKSQSEKDEAWGKLKEPVELKIPLLKQPFNPLDRQFRIVKKPDGLYQVQMLWDGQWENASTHNRFTLEQAKDWKEIADRQLQEDILESKAPKGWDETNVVR